MTAAISACKKDKILIPGRADKFHGHGKVFQDWIVICFTAMDGYSLYGMRVLLCFCISAVGEKITDNGFFILCHGA